MRIYQLLRVFFKAILLNLGIVWLWYVFAKDKAMYASDYIAQTDYLKLSFLLCFLLLLTVTAIALILEIICILYYLVKSVIVVIMKRKYTLSPSWLTICVFSILLNLCCACYVYANDKAGDVIHYAAQIGRLDLISLLLTIVTIALVLGGLYSFLHIKEDSRKIAEATAETTVVSCVQEYLDRRLPSMLDSRLKVFEGLPKAEDANNMANNFEDEEINDDN